jgi:beta-glucosidase
MKKLFIPACFIAASIMVGAVNKADANQVTNVDYSRATKYYAFQDTALTDEARVADLLKQLTIDEKLQLLSTSLGVERLGIPAYGHVEGLHGLTLGGPAMWGGKLVGEDGKVTPTDKFTTIFPQSCGLASTWQPELLRKVGEVAAREMRYYVDQNEGKHGGLVLRGPNADLARDPRWGRTEESFGEDAVLTARLTEAYVHGVQGDNPRYWRAASLMKHFLANSNEDGRDSTSSNFSERLFREYYSYPFFCGITRGGSRAFMASYNAMNGVPMTINPCLETVTRQEWGNDGIICTDGGALSLLLSPGHGYFTDRAVAVAECIKAGITQILDRYKEDAYEALRRNLISETDIDRCISGNLRVALRLGGLDADSIKNPYANVDVIAPYELEDIRQLVREITAKSVVLLKNSPINGSDQKVLPFGNDVHTVAVVGSYAEQIVQDWYSGTPAYAVTIAEGLRREGYEVITAANNSCDAAVEAARRADVALVCVGNHPYGTRQEWKFCPVSSDGREAVDRESLTLADEDLALLVGKANPRTVMVLVSNFSYSINRTNDRMPAIVQISHCSQEQGTGLADVLTGRVNPAGRTIQTWVRDVTELPDMMDYDLSHGRTYMYYQGSPLYPFGYGLSYTTFAYSNAEKTVNANGDVLVSVDLTNSGDRDGEEVVQLYVSYPDSKVSRPVKQLEDFNRVAIKAGQTQRVELMIPASRLGLYWDEDNQRYVNEPTPYTITVGPNSQSGLTL